MKKKFKNRTYIIAWISFLLIIMLNYMAYMGILFKYSQIETSNMYTNLLSPPSFVFSIWVVIYIGMILFLIMPLGKKLSMSDDEFYYDKLIPIFIGSSICNVLWTITWNNDLIMPALIAIMAYTVTLVHLVKAIDRNKKFSEKYKIFVTIPSGLHAGWLLFSTFTNVITILVKEGNNPFGIFGLFITLVLLIISWTLIFYVYKENPNIGLVIPLIWALFGLVIKHKPGSSFSNPSLVVLFLSIILLILSVICVYMLKRNKQFVKFF
ncbi:hypothetical protein HV819_10005 [Anaerococcus sp. AGMB00486]|uniref:Tryptophan-rich sensory protein n=1 Tax=Anaerococcus faecalis TaxID=2742993 RepID=A0ABX2NC71_9FIRM|nr:tryptophan-rich sensory protein [Anaerococcus faecalis]NVF12288.1 hypothetical protein [Anaerococcus faecalis]